MLDICVCVCVCGKILIRIDSKITTANTQTFKHSHTQTPNPFALQISLKLLFAIHCLSCMTNGIFSTRKSFDECMCACVNIYVYSAYAILSQNWLIIFRLVLFAHNFGMNWFAMLSGWAREMGIGSLDAKDERSRDRGGWGRYGRRLRIVADTRTGIMRNSHQNRRWAKQFLLDYTDFK